MNVKSKRQPGKSQVMNLIGDADIGEIEPELE